MPSKSIPCLQMEYEVYVDGACSVSEMLGGYAAIVTYENGRVVLSGCKKKSTNNEMEILAAIHGISAVRAIDKNPKIKVYSDSAYVVNCINEKWHEYWSSHEWKTRTGKEVSNRKLWKRLIALCDDNVRFIKVKGHSNNEMNSAVDKLAVQQRLYLKQLQESSK